MAFDLQPRLSGRLLHLRPLLPDDFDALYSVAADPQIWEQHPVREHHQLEFFRGWFARSLESGGALIAIENRQNRVIGSSRYHSYNEAESEVVIGHSFLARAYWGGVYNGEMKHLMLRHAYQFVENVLFLVGPGNSRSRNAVEKIGGVPVGMRPDSSGRDAVVYRMRKVDVPFSGD